MLAICYNIRYNYLPLVFWVVKKEFPYVIWHNFGDFHMLVGRVRSKRIKS